MSDIDERHEEYKPSHGIENHPWEITYIGDENEEIYYTYWGSKKGCMNEMHRIFDDNFDGGIDSDGFPPYVPEVSAECQCGDTLDMGTRNKY